MNQNNLFFVLDGKKARLFTAIEVVESNGVPSISANEISPDGKTIGEGGVIPKDQALLTPEALIWEFKVTTCVFAMDTIADELKQLLGVVSQYYRHLATNPSEWWVTEQYFQHHTCVAGSDVFEGTEVGELLTDLDPDFTWGDCEHSFVLPERIITELEGHEDDDQDVAVVINRLKSIPEGVFVDLET